MIGFLKIMEKVKYAWANNVYLYGKLKGSVDEVLPFSTFVQKSMKLIANYGL